MRWAPFLALMAASEVAAMEEGGKRGKEGWELFSFVTEEGKRGVEQGGLWLSLRWALRGAWKGESFGCSCGGS